MNHVYKLTGGSFLTPSGNPNDHASLQSGGTIVQYSNQDGNLVSYVPGKNDLKNSQNVPDVLYDYS